ncbi:Hypothetical protein PP7435_CHR3-1231 [Komagataella phaffii CBS 7435]|uniref:Uncharacterized protein n=1 Tax=Komagataella phaffii (strain ATCC 76273 / CBS 7435 / CECT 11047 / NRRL Y-11430 / Wegner 21-1) TaxID=981350 RepID=F2QXP3_KOMPC|nr:Hypothetical protein BQ9382_C3-6472 [Komagataella phaffii CBS 7435]CCA40171.1 Hypothetical protein PP7435_CHR3-1231 [Komagataella phaffii CBS 7435]
MYRDVLNLSKVTDLDPELLNSTIIPAPGDKHVVLFPLKKGTLLAALTIGAAYRVDPKIKENFPIWLEVYESARKIHAEQVALTSRRMGYVLDRLRLSEKALSIYKTSFKWIHDSDPKVEIEKSVFAFFDPDTAFNLDWPASAKA